VFFEKDLFEKRKNSSKTSETPSVTGGLRTGDSKKIESIRINLRELTWSQVFIRDPELLHPWNPGTRPGTTPGIPSKVPVASPVLFSHSKGPQKRTLQSRTFPFN
jgi:hypothetical protein